MALNQKKLPHDTFLLAGRRREDHVSGPLEGTNHFSTITPLSTITRHIGELWVKLYTSLWH